ncbi:hypothetical protein BDW62DRAFT_142126 [Aspergillus aurantiobrunneus]
MDSSASQAQPGSRSRRSYPSLNQVSLAPLTPSYPIDDDNDLAQRPQDYFSPRNEALDTPTRTSYLASYSVPNTPGVLSHTPSRSASRARHHSRSKSSVPTHLSESNLQGQNASQVPHHHSRASESASTSRVKRSATHRHHMSEMRDSEWMLRAGVALASSAREEKGQSWLAKRESSTSLVSEGGKYEVDTISQALRTDLSRLSRSGWSTPAAASSRSRAASRRNSRPDLAMTGLEMTIPSSHSKRSSFQTISALRTPSYITNDEARSSISLLPDFIDGQVRAEMQNTIQQQVEGDCYNDAESDYWDSEEEDEEIDERELQRLTRERGFGLGSWVDRMVEWTLFGVDDWPLFSTADPVTHQLATAALEPHLDHEYNQPAPESSDNDDDETRSLESDINTETISPKRAGDRGGWEDAGWLFRTIKQALIST